MNTHSQALRVIQSPMPFAWQLTHAEIKSQLNAPFCIRIQGYLLQENISSEQFIHQAFSIAFQSGEEKPRLFHGIIETIKLWETSDAQYFEFILTPWTARLEKTFAKRRYYEKDVLTIFKEICAEQGEYHYQIEVAILEKIPDPHFIQYEESDWAFILRLLSLYKLFYYFRHEEDKHILMITDQVMHQAALKTYVVENHPEHFMNWKVHYQAWGNLKSDHWITGTTTSTLLDLETALEENQQSFWIEAITYDICPEKYEALLIARSLAQPFSPASYFPPILNSAITQVHTEKNNLWQVDAEGKIQVQFFWEPEISVKKWVPLATPIAGHLWGMQALPRKSDLAYLGFLHGNPEKPIMLGSLSSLNSVPLFNLANAAWITGYQTLQHAFYFQDADPKPFVKIEVMQKLSLFTQKNYTSITRGDYQASLGKDQVRIQKSAMQSTKQDLVLTGGKGSIRITPDRIEISGPKVEFCN